MADEIASPKEKEKDINPAELTIPEELPVLPLNDFVFFPGMGFPLQISNKPSRQLIDDALLKDRLVAVVSFKKTADKKNDATATENLYSRGSACYIHKLIKAKEGYYQVVMSAVKKIKINEYTSREPYLRAKVEVLEMKLEEDQEVEAHLLNLRTQFKKMVTGLI